MSGTVSPRTADTIRKITAYLIAGFGTWYLLRVLYRLANGKASWTDPDLWVFLVLAALMITWVIAAKPMRRRPPQKDGGETHDGEPQNGETRGPSQSS